MGKSYISASGGVIDGMNTSPSISLTLFGLFLHIGFLWHCYGSPEYAFGFVFGLLLGCLALRYKKWGNASQEQSPHLRREWTSLILFLAVLSAIMGPVSNVALIWRTWLGKPPVGFAKKALARLLQPWVRQLTYIVNGSMNVSGSTPLKMMLHRGINWGRLKFEVPLWT